MNSRARVSVPRATRALLGSAVAISLTTFATTNLITGDGGRASAPADMSRLNMVRAIYDSEGGMGEAYYAYDGRVWARWETDFPQGDDNFSHRLTQLTRINVNPVAASRMLTAPDLGDFPMLYMSDPGYMVAVRRGENRARTLSRQGRLRLGR